MQVMFMQGILDWISDNRAVFWLLVAILIVAILLIIAIIFDAKKTKKKKATNTDGSDEKVADVTKVESIPKAQPESPKPAPTAKPIAAVPVIAPNDQADLEIPADAEIVDDDDSESQAETAADESTPQAMAKYHVSQEKNPKSNHHKRWRVRKGGSQKTIKFFDTQKEAIAYAEKLAESAGSSIVIHRLDGKIRKQNYTKKD